MNGHARERVLEGGNLSTVVRVGDTVRRPTGPWTPTVHALLRHLEERGFDAAPRALGVDARGREILTYIPGETVGADPPWAGWVWSDETLVAAGRMLRAYHEAVRDFGEPPDARYRLSRARLGPGEIVCHNDFAPYNLVLRPDGRLGLIDWDVAGPGIPAFDLAFAACTLAPMHEETECRRLGADGGARRIERLRLLLDSYGLDERAGFVELMEARLQASIDRITSGAAAGDPAFQALIAKGLLEPVHASRAWIARRRGALHAAIGS